MAVRRIKSEEKLRTTKPADSEETQRLRCLELAVRREAGGTTAAGFIKMAKTFMEYVQKGTVPE